MDERQAEFVRVMTEVARIETEVEQADAHYGTKRPGGPSDGRLYERLGIFVVAMCRVGCCPSRALNLIEQLSEMPAEARSYMHLTGLIMEPGDAVFLPALANPES